MTRPGHVVNQEDLEWETDGRGTRPSIWRRKALARATGGQKIGTSLMELDPGCAAWAYHYHGANEEALFVLSGRGQVRFQDQQVAVSEGDYFSFPLGPEGAHQVRNDSEDILRYLIFSTMNEPDIAIYPDSNKIWIGAGSGPLGDTDQRWLSTILPLEGEVDYWYREEE